MSGDRCSDSDIDSGVNILSDGRAGFCVIRTWVIVSPCRRCRSLPLVPFCSELCLLLRELQEHFHEVGDAEFQLYAAKDIEGTTYGV